MNDERVTKLGELLHQAGELHHVYYGDVDGVDDDWATFYLQWLLSRSPFPQPLARPPVRSGLTRDLVHLDEDYVGSRQTEPWNSWYARRLVEKYG